MISFPDWLDRVLSLGESVQDAAPVVTSDERGHVAAILHEAFERHAFDVAGPPVIFDPKMGIAAAEVLARACWLHASSDASEAVSLELKAGPSSASAHLSADVTLRFLPAVLRRARAHQPESRLVKELDRLLRTWPLSGVLAELDGAPSTPTDFGGHSGLQLLYAERLVEIDRPGWVPPTGPGREWVERVYHERGNPVPIQLPRENDRA